MSFLDILLEAKGDKKPKPTKIAIKPDDEETTDYTEEEEPTEEDDTSETEDETDDEEDASDYTEEEDEVDPEEEGEDPEESETDDPGTEEPTDYAEETPDDSSEEGDSDSIETEGEPSEDVEDPQAESEIENNRILMDDFVNIYYASKNTISKLSSIDKSNIAINMIVTQITSNLNMLEKQLFEYITFTFAANKYVTNLYKYNYFLEAFKINVQMLKKISVFIPN